MLKRSSGGVTRIYLSLLTFFLAFSFRSEGKVLNVREVKLAGPSKEIFFSRPRDLETEGSRLFVLDNQESVIRVFSFDGEPVMSIGKYGQGPGEFVTPPDMSLGEGEVAVLDADNQRIQFFSTEGAYLGGFKTGSRGHEIARLSRDRIVISYMPGRREKEVSLLRCFDRQGKIIWEAERISSSGDSAYDFWLFEHTLLVAGGKLVLLKKFNQEYALFFDNQGQRVGSLSVSPDYPTMQLKLSLPKSGRKNIQAVFWEAAESEGYFYLICPGKMDDGDIGPSKRVARLDSQGRLLDFVDFPVTVFHLAVNKNRFFITDEEGRLRIFDLIRP